MERLGATQTQPLVKLFTPNPFTCAMAGCSANAADDELRIHTIDQLSKIIILHGSSRTMAYFIQFTTPSSTNACASSGSR